MIKKLFYRLNPMSKTVDKLISDLALAQFEIGRLKEMEQSHQTTCGQLQAEIDRKVVEITTLTKNLENCRHDNTKYLAEWNSLFSALAKYKATITFKDGALYSPWYYVLSFRPKLYQPGSDRLNPKLFLTDDTNLHMVTEIIRKFRLNEWEWNEETITLSRRYFDNQGLQIGKDMAEVTDWLQGHVNNLVNTEVYRSIVYQTMKGGNGNGDKNETVK